MKKALIFHDLFCTNTGPKSGTRTGNAQSSPKCQQPVILWSMNSNKKKTAKWILNWDDDMDHLLSEIYGKTWTWYTRNFYSETKIREAIIKQMTMFITITPKIKERNDGVVGKSWFCSQRCLCLIFTRPSSQLGLDWKWINITFQQYDLFVISLTRPVIAR